MSFLSKKFDSSKLKTNLRVSINRLKLLEKKKTEISLKSRKEISDYLSENKDDRARIKVEQIIREDYLVEAMEIIEMFCDLLLARMGLLQTSKEVDPGLEESIATLIWVAPRLQSDVPEFKMILNQLQLKYGKEFIEACSSNSLNNVSEKIMQKLSCQAPPKPLVEQYLVEIAKSYNIPFEPDPSLMEVPDLDDMIAICPPDPDFLHDSDSASNGTGGGYSNWGPNPPYAGNYPPTNTYGENFQPGNYGQQQPPYGGNHPNTGHYGESAHYNPNNLGESYGSKQSFTDVGNETNNSQTNLNMGGFRPQNENDGASNIAHEQYGEKSKHFSSQPHDLTNNMAGSDPFVPDSSTFPPTYDQSVIPQAPTSGHSGMPYPIPPQIPSRPPAGPLPPVGGSMSDPNSESAGSMELDDLVKRFEDLKKKSG